MFKPQTLNFGSGLQTDELTFTTWETNESITLRVQDISGVLDMPVSKEFPADSGPVARIYFGEHSVLVRDSRVLILAAIAALGPTFTDGYMMLQDQKSDGSGGGTFTNGAWRTRDLNTEVEDTSNLVTLSANQMTLEPGDYVIHARCPAGGVFGNQVRLRNIDAGSTILTGSNTYLGNPSVFNADVDFAELQGLFSLAIQTVLEIQHTCQITVATIGLGTSIVLFEANTEVYTTVEIWSVTI